MTLLGSGALTSCSDQTRWTYEGVHQVLVETIDAPETIHVGDTLTVVLEGYVPEYGNAEFSHVETARDPHQAAFTVWADCYAWAGCGPTPPLPFWVRCEPQVPPPFDPGELFLMAHCPDSSAVSDTVQVVASARIP